MVPDGPEEEWRWYRKAQAERGVRGWSYAELARRVGESERSIRKWLCAEREPREGIVAKIAAAIGWPLDLLTDPKVPYLLEVQRQTNLAWLKATLKDLDENGKKVVAALSDPQAAAFLAAQLDQYRAIRRNAREARGRPVDK